MLKTPSFYHNKLFITTVLLCLIVVGVGTSQENSFTRDSLKIEKLTKNMDRFYSDPLRYKKDLPDALYLVDSLLSIEADNLYLMKKKISILHYGHYFTRRRLKGEVLLREIYEAKSLREKIGDSCGLNVVYRQLTGFWRSNKNLDKALEFSEKGLSIAKKCNDTKNQILSELSKSEVLYYQNKNNDTIVNQILQEYKRIYEWSKKENYDRGVGVSLSKMITIYFSKKDYIGAKDYLKELEAVSMQRNDIIKLKSVYRRLGTYYKRGEKNITKALPYYIKSVALNEQLQDSLSLDVSYLGLSNTLHDLGRHEEALLNYKKYAIIKNTKSNIENYQNILNLEAEYRYNEQKKIDSLQFIQKQKKIQFDIKQQANKKFWITITFLLVLLSILTIYYLLYRKKAISNELKMLKMDQKIQNKSEQVNNLLNETLKHIKQKEKIATDLNKVIKNESDISLSSILADLRSEKAENSKLIALREDIEKNSYDFISRLKEQYPLLTKTDLEICALIRLQIPKKEIAIIRGVRENTIKTSRMRIRKKMNLSQDVMLNAFLVDF